MKLDLYARAVIVHNGRILVNRHGDDIRFFGGKVKASEKVEKALVRELQEELSLPVEISVPLLAHDEISKKSRTTTLYFGARVLSTKPESIATNEPHLAPHWLSPNDIAFDSIEPKRLQALLKRMLTPSRFFATSTR